MSILRNTDPLTTHGYQWKVRGRKHPLNTEVASLVSEQILYPCEQCNDKVVLILSRVQIK